MFSFQNYKLTKKPNHMNRTHCKKVFHGLIIAAALVSNAPSGFAQKKNVKNKNTAAIATDSVFNALKWRNIGPFRAGIGQLPVPDAVEFHIAVTLHTFKIFA